MLLVNIAIGFEYSHGCLRVKETLQMVSELGRFLFCLSDFLHDEVAEALIEGGGGGQGINLPTF